MPEKMTDNFINLCLHGEVLLEEMDEWIDKWRDTPQQIELHEYLGMSWPEYYSWISTPEILPFIVAANKENKDFEILMEDFQSLPLADSKQAISTIVKWIKKQGLL